MLWPSVDCQSDGCRGEGGEKGRSGERKREGHSGERERSRLGSGGVSIPMINLFSLRLLFGCVPGQAFLSQGMRRALARD